MFLNAKGYAITGGIQISKQLYDAMLLYSQKI